MIEFSHTFLPILDKKKYLISQTLSFLCLKKQNLKINLYSTKEHLNLCKNIGLEYDSFNEIDFNKYYDIYWSCSKMQVLKIEKKQIIIDLDTFLLKDITENLINYDLICQNEEIFENNEWYMKLMNEFKDIIPLKIIPEWDFLIDKLFLNNQLRSEAKYEKAYNCAVLGFKNPKIAKDYAEKSILIYEFLRKKYSIEYLKNIKLNFLIPTIPEQLFLKFYAEYHNLNCECIIKNIHKSNNFYIHLSNTKTQYHVQEKILANIRNININIYKNLLQYTV
jgi:hypothetical protein